jgi:hypothetical protein
LKKIFLGIDFLVKTFLGKKFPWSAVPWNGFPWKKISLLCRITFQNFRTFKKTLSREFVWRERELFESF